ncbi:MAG: aspartate/glutamate racemase family protein [Rhizobiales bacterium]|nr:aspartate/glutamate racemase family protein [Hyphomicrobiales bacterium]
MTVARGGKSIYGASVGVLMLDARFPRIVGDMGNALTWPFPVHYRIVRGATPERAVAGGADGLLAPFIAAARQLQSDGVDGITTNCGFLSLYQDELRGALDIPVATSSLMQVPAIAATLPRGRHVSILTISAASLTPAHLEAAGVPPGTPVVGTEQGEEFTRVILGDEPLLDVAKARADMLVAGRSLMAQHPATGAILLECTNMVPYAADLAEDLGVPVFSIYSFIVWFQAGLRPRRFP